MEKDPWFRILDELDDQINSLFEERQNWCDWISDCQQELWDAFDHVIMTQRELYELIQEAIDLSSPRDLNSDLGKVNKDTTSDEDVLYPPPPAPMIEEKESLTGLRAVVADSFAASFPEDEWKVFLDF